MDTMRSTSEIKKRYSGAANARRIYWIRCEQVYEVLFCSIYTYMKACLTYSRIVFYYMWQYYLKDMKSKWACRSATFAFNSNILNGKHEPSAHLTINKQIGCITMNVTDVCEYEMKWIVFAMDKNPTSSQFICDFYFNWSKEYPYGIYKVVTYVAVDLTVSNFKCHAEICHWSIH